LPRLIDAEVERLAEISRAHPNPPKLVEVGVVVAVSGAVATVRGLPNVGADEVVHFEGGGSGLALDLRHDAVGVVVLHPGAGVRSGSAVHRSQRVLDTPVGEALLGRVVDPLGHPRDGLGRLAAHERWPVERPAPTIFERAPVREPLQTGIKVIDALFPLGRGQRELIVGDRQTGKSTLAITALLAQRETGVRGVLCCIGQRSAETARWLQVLRDAGVLERCAVVVAAPQDSAGLRTFAPYAAMSIAESWMHAGHDVLIVFDDLTAHARAYRELSLLLRRPPGREAYPGDIFYLHARLLERATRLRAGGSVTALPIIETQAHDLSAFIPTNLISITDGQIALSSTLAARGMLPAVDVGRSVSRVGGKAQSPGYRRVAGDLRLAYAQFEELEGFARIGSELDAQTRQRLRRGRRVRAVLRQAALGTQRVGEQLLALQAVVGGDFDALPVARVPEVEGRWRDSVAERLPEYLAALEAGEDVGDELTARRAALWAELLVALELDAVEERADGDA
jgi:F-type H+-transporting ATPase subunit alpha